MERTSKTICISEGHGRLLQSLQEVFRNLMKVQKTKKLHNGVEIPVIGFGTWKMLPGPTAYKAVQSALEVGYRHVDTARIYLNEQSVGKAVRESGIKRE